MPAHTERRYSPYSVEQVFDLVADVERYPEFLPWMRSCRIVGRGKNTVSVDMILGLGPLQQHFHSHAALERPRAIHISSKDPPFEWFEQQWRFIPDGTCSVIEYSYDFRLHSSFLELVSSALLDEAVRTTIGAFEQRAIRVYGNSEPGIKALHDGP